MFRDNDLQTFTPNFGNFLGVTGKDPGKPFGDSVIYDSDPWQSRRGRTATTKFQPARMDETRRLRHSLLTRIAGMRSVGRKIRSKEE